METRKGGGGQQGGRVETRGGEGVNKGVGWRPGGGGGGQKGGGVETRGGGGQETSNVVHLEPCPPVNKAGMHTIGLILYNR